MQAEIFFMSCCFELRVVASLCLIGTGARSNASDKTFD